MNSKVIELKQGEHCNIQQTNCAYQIEGPAYIVVLQDEAAVGTTASDELRKQEQQIISRK